MRFSALPSWGRHACGEVGGQAELLVGGPDETAQAALAHPQALQVLQRLRLFQLLQLSLYLGKGSIQASRTPALRHDVGETGRRLMMQNALAASMPAHSLSLQ